jgi:hypothetical protein
MASDSIQLMGSLLDIGSLPSHEIHRDDHAHAFRKTTTRFGYLTIRVPAGLYLADAGVA